MDKEKSKNSTSKIIRPSKSNYFEVPNQLTDEFYCEIPPSALKIYLFLIRKTWGWHKCGDWVAMSQFTSNTGMTKKTVLKNLKWLEEEGYIWSVKVGDEGREQKLYFIMSEEGENLRQMVDNKVIDEAYLRKIIQLETDQGRYKKSVKLGTFLT